MIPKEIIKHIRRIEIRSGKLVNEIFAGQYSSVFKGRGMEFAEVREYMPGDDIRAIDWNVTARYGRPFIKKFTEERELTVILLVDASGSQKFGSRSRQKSELAAEIASVLAFSAIKNNDRVGMITFTDRIEKVIRPKKGKNHILRLIREILCCSPQSRGTNLALPLQYLNELWRRKAVVFLISDFRDEGFDSALKVTARRHDLVAVKISDPRENELPKVGLIELEDAETGARRVVDTDDEMAARLFSEAQRRQDETVNSLCTRAGVDRIDVSTAEPYVMPLIRFFKRREKRLAF
ncbi:MAG: hypothetical protein A2219_00455 [Elusimicrobia bacterium RIFOXYA2_FULL_50_26]|nr:MAG: hypothetical protein A2219_00455 [Elusimicrobia bacterium RIFOXYA2_FULL_50_26]OGS24671.1 MAG: hypothetical protein A2314_03770 [Elusimicrobia bacterium RIFOXYB2_FULL_50_12]